MFQETSRILLASILTAFILHLYADYFHILFIVPLSIVIYATAFFLLQGLSRDGFKKDQALNLWQDFYQTILPR